MTRQEVSGGFGWDQGQKPSTRLSHHAYVVVEGLEDRVLLTTVGERSPNVPAYVTTAFETAYNRTLGWGERNSVYLGTPSNTVHRWGQGYIQDFHGGRYGDGAIMMADTESSAYAIWGKHWELYRQQPAIQATNPASVGVDWLGYPISDHYNPAAAEAKQLKWYENSGPPANLKQGSVIRFQTGYITFKEGTPFAWWTRLAPTSAEPLTLTVRSSSQIDLSWKDVVGEDGYRIFKSKNGVWLQIGQVGRGVTSFSVNNLPPGTTQSFFVEAYNTVGSKATSAKSASTLAEKKAPTTPEPLTLTVRSSSQIDLSWVNSTGEDGYRIYQWDGYRGPHGDWVQIASVGRDITTYSVKNLQPATTQFFKVAAFNAVGSAETNFKSAVTPTQSQTGFRYPLADARISPFITQSFGDEHQEPDRSWLRGHLGDDYRARTPLPVYTIAPGIVTRARDYGGKWGRVVIIEHRVPGQSQPVYSMYAHLSAILVTEGQTVVRDQRIGTTGAPPGGDPHLHFEIRTGAEAGTNPGPGYAGVKFTTDTRTVAGYAITWYDPSKFISDNLVSA